MQRLLASSSKWLRVATLAVLVSLLLTPVASAQTQTEADLRLRMAQQPNNVGTYLELARIYTDQQRYEEAVRVLQSAIALIQRTQVSSPGRASRQLIQPNSRPIETSIQAPVRVGGGIMEPKKIKHVAPVYPEIAQASRVQGVVILEVIVGPTGDVTDAKVLRSIPLLDQAAIDAVAQWKFTPTLLNGMPVSVVMTVTVNFSLQ